MLCHPVSTPARTTVWTPMSSVLSSARPRLLAAALVASSLALAVPLVAVGPTSAAPVPRPVAARMTSVALSPAAPDQAARAGSVAAAQSSVVETGGGLRVVGVTWATGDVVAGDRVEIRERTNGAWGGWSTLETEDDHAPDPGTAEAERARGGTEPLVTTADAVQVRVLGEHRTTGASARLDVVDPRSSSADRATPPTAGAAQAGSVKPTIYSRAKWGADESQRRGTTSFGTIRSAVVHHTAGTNSYTADQVPAILRGIYDFHVNGRGWNDIGYNFLIDKFGRIWEGRAGGVDLPVVGAQAGGYNSQTFGASTLGDFTSVAPPAAVVTAQSKLIAWKLGLTHIDPTGSTVIDGKGTLPRVIGHRNLNETSCPGAKSYALLPTIRTRAKAYQGTMLYEPTTSTTSLPYGSGSVTVTARASTSVSWTLSVSSVCRTDAQYTRSGSASTATPVSATWNGRLADGRAAPPGQYRLTVTASSGSGTAATSTPVVRLVTVQDAAGAPEGFCPPRLAGADRYATAVAVARDHASYAPTVVLASGEPTATADALVAAPLARAKEAALLLTQAARLPAVTRAEITRRAATSAFLVGGTGAISNAVANELASLGVTSVVRISGRDRYATAAAVAEAMGGSRPDVMVSSGVDGSMVDGLVLSGPAAALGRPILLVERDRVPSATLAALTTLGATSTVVAGGTGAVSDAVVSSLPAARRLAGTSRFTTATAVATWAKSVMPVDRVVLASGEDGSLVDMLSAGQLGRPILISTSTSMPSSTGTWLAQNTRLSQVVVVGGQAAVSDPVAGLAQAAVLS
jgi:putative cell wall-binding protein